MGLTFSSWARHLRWLEELSLHTVQRVGDACALTMEFSCAWAILSYVIRWKSFLVQGIYPVSVRQLSWVAPGLETSIKAALRAKLTCDREKLKVGTLLNEGLFYGNFDRLKCWKGRSVFAVLVTDLKVNEELNSHGSVSSPHLSKLHKPMPAIPAITLLLRQPPTPP